MEDVPNSVLVAGATGGTGREIIRLLDNRSPTVTAMTRSAENEDMLRTLGADQVVVDDLLSPSNLKQTLADVDVILSAVGSSPRAILSSEPLVDGAGNQALIDAAIQTDVDQFIMESALGVGPEPHSALGTIFNIAIKRVQRAKEQAENALREGQIAYTIIRAGILTNGPLTREVTVAKPGTKLWGTISRKDVAWIMTAALVTPELRNSIMEAITRPNRQNGMSVDWALPPRQR